MDNNTIDNADMIYDNQTVMYRNHHMNTCYKTPKLWGSFAIVDTIEGDNSFVFSRDFYMTPQ